MPTTLGAVLTDTRSHLDETSARYWSDSELTNWINEAARDIGRRAEVIQSFNSNIQVFPNTNKYELPSDVIRLHRLEFVPTGVGQTQIYPVSLTTYDEMDQVWGVIQNSQMSYPSFAVMWGFPPGLTIQLFPVPSSAGYLNLFYYRLPAVLVNTTDVVEVPEGWWDLIPMYAEFMAKRKDRDPLWEEAKKLYEERLATMVDVTRQWHDQNKAFTQGTSAVPRWLYEFDW